VPCIYIEGSRKKLMFYKRHFQKNLKDMIFINGPEESTIPFEKALMDEYLKNK
jgi:hypothetical protein